MAHLGFSNALSADLRRLQQCRGSNFSKQMEGEVLSSLCTLGPACFIAVNMEKSERRRWLKPPRKSDSCHRGILFVGLCWAGQHTVYGMDGTVKSEPSCPPQPQQCLHSLKGECRGDEILRLSV